MHVESSLHRAHPTQLAIIRLKTYFADAMMGSQEMKHTAMVIKISLIYIFHISNKKSFLHQGYFFMRLFLAPKT